MGYEILADLVVFLHALFVLFVIFGGVMVWHRPRLAWLHLPAAIWGVTIEAEGWVCPLTYLENYLRRLGGAAGYQGSFIERYLEPLLYPLGLTHRTQLCLGAFALLVNLAVYARLLGRRRRE